MSHHPLFSIFLALLPTLVAAQQLTPSVVGSAGGYFQTISGDNLHFTVGEIAIATTNNGLVLERGFHHGIIQELSTGVWSARRITLDLAVYPNPTPDRVTVSGSWQPDDRLTMYDLFGRRLLDRPLAASQIDLELGAYPPGTYLLVILRRGQPVGRARILRQ